MHHSLKLQKMKLSTTTITTALFSGKSPPFLRHFSTRTAAIATVSQPDPVSKGFLFQKLYELGPSETGKVSSVLYETMRRGKQFNKSILIDCLKDLRKLGRYHHCLQILDWLEKGRYTFSSGDRALRLIILCKHKGLDEVEKYFNSIPDVEKDHSVYGALLNCYTTKLETDKAVATFKKMEEMGCEPNVLAFNNLLTLYVKVGQPEKVPELIAEMKHRNIALNGYSYSFWIKSFQFRGDLEGVERVFQEAEEQATNDWELYSNTAEAYIKLGQPEKAVTVLQKLEDVLDVSESPDRVAYNHLISLYASAGKLESVIQAWNNLKSKFNVTNTPTYLCMLRALSNLDDIKGLEKYFREWESNCKRYDDRPTAVFIGAYLKHDMLEEAELLLKEATKKAGQVLPQPHVKFMNYCFKKRQTDSALKHMEVAVDANWKPHPDKLDACFQYFKDEKDVDGAERFCHLLKRARSLDDKDYSWLQEIYAASGKLPKNEKCTYAESNNGRQHPAET